MRLQYKGLDRMYVTGPGFQLFHGVHYDVELSTLRNRKIRLEVRNDFGSITGTYPDLVAVRRDWCYGE